MNDEEIAALLQWAGPRPQVNREIQERSRAAFRDDFARSVVRRSRRRLFAGAGLMAAAVAAAFLIRQPATGWKNDAPPRLVVAFNQPGREPIFEDALLQTGPHDTSSIDWHGSTLRLDRNTRVRLRSASLAILERGAVYYATETGPRAIGIRTPYGTVYDAGTQFQVRLDDAFRVRVREGKIELRRDGDVFAASAGQELVLTAAGADVHDIRPYGNEWSWIERAAPRIVLEGMTLEEVVNRVAREKGLRVQWKNRAVAAQRLHGSTPLPLDDALAAAVAAATRTHRIADGALIIQ